MDANGHEETHTNRRLTQMYANSLVVGLAVAENARRIERSRQNRKDPQITQISLGGLLAMRGKGKRVAIKRFSTSVAGRIKAPNEICVICG
jgi:hypothetical protein